MPVDNTAVVTQEVTQTQVRVLKRQPGLGRLNRLIASATEILVANGHANKRFKRDYNTGSATYTCSHCNSVVVAKLEQSRGKTSVQGDALVAKCSGTNS